MLHVWVIALLGAIIVHDAVPRWGGSPTGQSIWGLCLTPLLMLCVAVVQHISLLAAARELASRGTIRSVILADRTLTSIRATTVFVHALGVLVFGWLDAIRSILGDLIIIDELVCLTPALLVLSAGWWSYFPLESHLRESVVMRNMDRGFPVYPIPTRWQWVISNVRHQLLLGLVPLLMIAAWSEMSPLLIDRIWPPHAGDSPEALRAESIRLWAQLGASLLGAVTIFAFTPLIVRYIWDTVRLAPGAMRSRLERMCDLRGVRVRELLVWRTHGTMINGAVMGLAAPVRFILLTDALLDQLPERQVEAVMAHELAHAKLSHLPWLGVCLISGVGLLTAGGVLVAHALTSLFPPDSTLEIGTYWSAQFSVQFIGLAGGIAIFGYVSRRFEWQADAFAAKHLSTLPRDDNESATETGRVLPEGAAGMIEALESVAILNHVPKATFSFRHGSIHTRQRRLRALVGAELEALPIDRDVRRIKAAALVALLALIAVSVWDLARPIDPQFAPLEAESVSQHRVPGHEHAQSKYPLNLGGE